jgi:hypothetical protein
MRSDRVVKEARTAVALVEELRQGLAGGHGLVYRTYQDSGEVAVDWELLRTTFRTRCDEVRAELAAQYGACADPDVARSAGIDPERLVGIPGAGAQAAEAVFFAWRKGPLLLFAAAGAYVLKATGRCVIVLGAARDSAEARWK